MKQIYLKFSMLLLCLAMGLNSMGQVTQTVTGCTYSGTADNFGRFVWTTSNDDNAAFQIMANNYSFSGKDGATFTLENVNAESGYVVQIDDVDFSGSGKGTVDVTKSNNSVTFTLRGSNGKLNYTFSSITITYSYTPVTLNLTSAGYATFCAPYDVVIPSGVTASKITGSAPTENAGEYSLNLTATSNNLPAGTPVILSGEALEEPVTYIGVATVSEDQNNTGNYLTGVYTDGIKARAGSYGLQVQNGTTAFYKASNGFNASKYRAYLTLPASTDAKMLSFGEITIPASISGASTEAQVSSIFSASGAKCSSMQKGLNIVKMNDGSVKKVFVK